MSFTSSSRKRKIISILLVSFLSGTAYYGTSHAALPAEKTVTQNTDDAPVDFVANTVEYDDIGQKVTAVGDVEIAQNGRIVKADRVVYDLKTEAVNAEGNVALMEKNGDVHFVDKAELEQGMKNGYIKKLRSVLADGSRLTAEEGHRINGERIEMKDATYTPCEPCKANPEKPPAWQIKADKVIHDNTDHTITYNNATFEVSGVPVIYVPYFSHPDGTVNQQSGLLPPTFSMSSDLGFSVTSKYYWAIDPSQDATFGVRAFLEQSPMLTGEYRKRFENGELEIGGSTIYADRTDRTNGGQYEYKNEEWRGNFTGKGRWDLDDKWRAGFNADIASDDQYLRQFDISNEDVLENEIYAERFENRNYAAVRALAFQDVRTSDRATEQPSVLPEMEASLLGTPGETLGGRWSFDAGALALTREGSGQDVGRVSVDAGWKRKDVLDVGIVNVISANLRADGYAIPKRDENLLGAGTEGDSTETRVLPIVHNVTSYPVIKGFDSGSQIVVEPMVSFTAATNVSNDDIPNEDSQDIQIDANNIFQSSRFPGLDRVEDQSHTTYGVRTGVHSPEGNKGEVFLGQSYRLDGSDSLFPKGSGLENRTSNYVGEISANYFDYLDLNYRFELASNDLAAQRHEMDLNSTLGRLSLSSSYLFAKALEGTDLLDSREQLYGSANYLVTDEWRVGTAARYDLGEENEGLRKASLTLQYLGQCYTIGTTVARNFTFESSGEASTEFTVRVGLKNLGEFGTE